MKHHYEIVMKFGEPKRDDFKAIELADSAEDALRAATRQVIYPKQARVVQIVKLDLKPLTVVERAMLRQGFRAGAKSYSEDSVKDTDMEDAFKEWLGDHGYEIEEATS